MGDLLAMHPDLSGPGQGGTERKRDTGHVFHLEF